MRVIDYYKAIRVAAPEVGLFESVRSVVSARLCYDIGPVYHSLFRLFSVPKSSWSSYIDSNECNIITTLINGRENRNLSKSKLRFYSHCLKNSLPTVPILAVIGDQGTHDDIYRIHSLADFDRFLLTCPPRLFFKIADGAHGDGAFSATRSGGDWLLKGETHNTESLYERVLKTGAAYLVQPVVKPHAEISKLMPQGALGTVRLITYLSENMATAILPILRIPAQGNMTDNFSLGLSGNLVAPIDLDSGTLGIAKKSSCTAWPSIVELFDHPDTEAKITGKVLPFWDKTLSLAIEAQLRTPQLPTLGWDIAVTDEGPLIVEANTLYATEIHEVAYGRGIRRDLEPVAALVHQTQVD